jgi:hypothetical protein
MGGNGMGGMGMGGGGECALTGVADPTDCDAACSVLYDCGALECNGEALCMFSGDAAEKATFVGDAMSGCIETCSGMMVLIGLLDPTDCAMTIATLKGASADFTAVCDNGISGAGGGGGGGGGM